MPTKCTRVLRIPTSRGASGEFGSFGQILVRCGLLQDHSGDCIPDHDLIVFALIEKAFVEGKPQKSPARGIVTTSKSSPIPDEE
jgi:hypothetical protein